MAAIFSNTDASLKVFNEEKKKTVAIDGFTNTYSNKKEGKAEINNTEKLPLSDEIAGAVAKTKNKAQKNKDRSEDNWECSKCTLKNYNAFTICEVCRTPRPTIWRCEKCRTTNSSQDQISPNHHLCRSCFTKNEEIEKLKAARNVDGSWNCPQCTGLNRYDRQTCIECLFDHLEIDELTPEQSLYLSNQRESKVDANSTSMTWNCPACTMLNNSDYKTTPCTACQSTSLQINRQYHQQQYDRKTQDEIKENLDKMKAFDSLLFSQRQKRENVVKAVRFHNNNNNDKNQAQDKVHVHHIATASKSESESESEAKRTQYEISMKKSTPSASSSTQSTKTMTNEDLYKYYYSTLSDPSVAMQNPNNMSNLIRCQGQNWVQCLSCARSFNTFITINRSHRVCISCRTKLT